MRRSGITLFVCLFICAFAAAAPAAAQPYGWCGYGLIEGLPLLENQLAVIAAITPTPSRGSEPDTLFQYRFNNTHTAVIIEGCFQVQPTREVIASLLQQVIEVSVEQPLPRLGAPGDVIIPVDPAEAARQYVNEHLTLSLFAANGTREESAASVRAYLAEHADDWETPEA